MSGTIAKWALEVLDHQGVAVAAEAIQRGVPVQRERDARAAKPLLRRHEGPAPFTGFVFSSVYWSGTTNPTNGGRWVMSLDVGIAYTTGGSALVFVWPVRDPWSKIRSLWG